MIAGIKQKSVGTVSTPLCTSMWESVRRYKQESGPWSGDGGKDRRYATGSESQPSILQPLHRLSYHGWYIIYRQVSGFRWRADFLLELHYANRTKKPEYSDTAFNFGEANDEVRGTNRISAMPKEGLSQPLHETSPPTSNFQIILRTHSVTSLTPVHTAVPLA
jgi:hypothetical protein